MKKFRNVLVIIETRQMRQPALERALALAQASGKDKVRITAVMPVFDFSWDLTSILSVEQEESMRESVIKKHQKWLDAYLRINAMGFDITSKVIWSKTIGKEITATAKEIGADLIVKTADVHGMLDSVIFTPLDWQLLRHSPVPVLIAKDQLWRPEGIIAVAVDLSDPSDMELRYINMRLLREAQELATITRCQIHLVNAIAPVVPPSSIDMPGFTPDLVGDEALKEGCRNVLAFAARHRISPVGIRVSPAP